jgi:hypothetical protein
MNRILVRAFHFLFLFVVLAITLSPTPVLAGSLQAYPTRGTLGSIYQFPGTGFTAGKAISLWVNDPNGEVFAGGSTQADSNGVKNFSVTPDTARD